MNTIRSLKVGTLQVNVYANRDDMGAAAAADAAAYVRELLKDHDHINVMFGAAPSQNEVLASFAASEGIDWSRVRAFHMDEYIGLDPQAPQGFGNFLYDHIFSLVPFGSVNYINGNAEDIDAECKRYGDLMAGEPLHVCFMGVGENGHVAFNDPPVADFNDAVLVKKVELEHRCRQQQVNDGCFASLDQVPTHAMTVTVPGLTRAQKVICVVPAPTKAEAVRRMLDGNVTTACPASIITTHPDATLYLDPDAGCSLL